MATRVGCGGIRLASFNSPSLKNYPLDTKILKIFLTEFELLPFCFKFNCRGNQGGLRQNFIGSIRWPNIENPSIDAKMSQISLAEAEL